MGYALTLGSVHEEDPHSALGLQLEIDADIVCVTESKALVEGIDQDTLDSQGAVEVALVVVRCKGL